MTKVVGILVVAVLLASFAAVHFWRELASARSNGAALAMRETALVHSQPAQSPVHAAAPAASPSAPGAAATAAVSSTSASREPARAAANPVMKGVMDALATPERQEAERAMQRAQMARTYPDIEQALGISAQEKRRLFDLMSDSGEAAVSLMAGSALDPAQRLEAQRKVVEVERARQMAVSTLLGSRYATWEEYQSQTQARRQVDQLREMLSASDAPLTQFQSQQLIPVIAAERKRANQESRDWNASSAASSSPNMLRESLQRQMDSLSRQVDVVAPVLSAAQLDIYRQQTNRQVTMLRASMGMMVEGDKP